MKVRVIQNFEGFPNGLLPIDYKNGSVVEVPDDYATLLIKKGHVVPDVAKPAATPAPASTDASPRPAAD